jgi:hypothetical protein
MKKSQILIGLLALCAVLAAFGCGTKSINSSGGNLEGTWWFSSASIDGTPVSSYSDVANDEDAVDASITFVTDGTWHADEFDDTPTQVFSQSGTYSASGNQLTIVTTMYGGAPENPPDTQTATYSVASDILTITATDDIMGTLIQTWEKE